MRIARSLTLSALLAALATTAQGQTWSAVSDGSTMGLDQSPNGGYVASYANSPVIDVGCVKFDANGDVVWQRYLDDAFSALLHGVVATADGGAYVYGLRSWTCSRPPIDAFWLRASSPWTDYPQRTIDLYDANLAWVDSVLGRLLDVLRTAGIYDEAWIVVTSDHGEAFWQHGRWGHNDRLHEEMVHVPLVVKPPGGVDVDGRAVGELVSLLDLVPSLIGWLGLVEASDLDGIPLPTAAVSSAGGPARRLLLRAHQRMPHLALRTPTEKLIVTVEEGEDGTLIWGRELYDLSADSEERRNLEGEMSAEQERVAERLRAWTLKLVDRAPGRSPIELPPEDAALLRELGYAD